MRKKTYLQIEASRNRRLWVTGVFMPVFTTIMSVGVAIYSGSPEVRYTVNSKLMDAKVWLSSKFKRNK